MGDLTWAERLKERVKNKQEERLYWVAHGCCVESYRRKYVEKGLVPEQVVPMSEEDKAHFRMTLETPAMPKIKEKPKKKNWLMRVEKNMKEKSMKLFFRNWHGNR